MANDSRQDAHVERIISSLEYWREYNSSIDYVVPVICATTAVDVLVVNYDDTIPLGHRRHMVRHHPAQRNYGWKPSDADKAQQRRCCEACDNGEGEGTFAEMLMDARAQRARKMKKGDKSKIGAWR